MFNHKHTLTTRSLESSHSWQSALISFSVSWVGPTTSGQHQSSMRKIVQCAFQQRLEESALSPTDPPPLLGLIRKFDKRRKTAGECHHAIWWTKIAGGNKHGCTLRKWQPHGFILCICWCSPFVSPARNCRAWRTKSDQQGTAENHVLRVLAGHDCHVCTLSSSWESKM